MIVETLHKERSLLERIDAFNQTFVSRVAVLLDNPNLRKVTEDFRTRSEARTVELGLNIFTIVSDLYYRENYHSDILRALLDPQSPHGEGDKYLRLFLEFLVGRGALLSVGNYGNATVVREQGRLDLLIADAISGRAIIVENKMNEAGDMPRQLPRYLEYVRNRNLTCDAIVYLRLNRDQQPDTKDWTADEVRDVHALLLCVSAYTEQGNDLYNGWLCKCAEAAQDIDAQLIFRQYGALVRKLGGRIMNKAIMEEFLKVMTQGENLKTAQSLRAMLDDLVLFRAERVADAFRSDLHPFQRVAIWAANNAFFTGFHWQGAHLGLDVIAEPDAYRLYFWDRNDSEGAKGFAKAALENMNCLAEFTPQGGAFEKKLLFPAQEEDLLDAVRAFKEKLAGLSLMPA